MEWFRVSYCPHFIDESTKTQGDEELRPRSCDKCGQEVGNAGLSAPGPLSSLLAALRYWSSKVKGPFLLDESVTCSGIRRTTSFEWVDGWKCQLPKPPWISSLFFSLRKTQLPRSSQPCFSAPSLEMEWKLCPQKEQRVSRRRKQKTSIREKWCPFLRRFL